MLRTPNVSALSTKGRGSSQLFTGRVMTAAKFVTHSRSERAIQRWDIAGRD